MDVYVEPAGPAAPSAWRRGHIDARSDANLEKKLVIHRSIMTGVAAAALALSPTLATAQSTQSAELAPAMERVEGNELRSRGENGFLLTAILAAAVALIIAALIKVIDDDNGRSVSP